MNVCEIKADVEQINNELARVRNLLLYGDIEQAAYRVIKADTENALKRLESKLIEVSKDQTVQISNHLKDALDALLRLKILFVNADNKEKRGLLVRFIPKN